MKKKKTNGASYHPPIYKSYVFKDKDPAIDKLRTVIEDHYGARLTSKMLRQIHESGGPSVGAMSGWFFGDTMRPQNPTIEAAGQSLGFERVWQRKGRK